MDEDTQGGLIVKGLENTVLKDGWSVVRRLKGKAEQN